VPLDLAALREDAEHAVWMEHESRAANLLGSLDPLAQLPRENWLAIGKPALDAWSEYVEAQPDENVASLVMLTIRKARDAPFGEDDLRWFAVENHLPLREVGWSDALLAGKTALQVIDVQQRRWCTQSAAMMVARAAPGSSLQVGDELSIVRELLDAVTGTPTWIRRHKKAVTVRRLRTLIPDDVASNVYASVLSPWDSWGATVLGQLAISPACAVASTQELLRHLDAAAVSKPSKKWLAGASEAVSPPPARAALKLMVETLLTSRLGPEEWVEPDDGGNENLVRAAVWATSLLHEDWVTPTLVRVADRCAERVANAAIRALGMIATPEAIAGLQWLADGADSKPLRTHIDAALAVGAQGVGLTPGELVEQTVPTGGLDADGTVTVITATGSARLSFGAELKVLIEWPVGDGWSGKAPKTADKADVAAVKARAKELAAALAAERRRLENLFALDRQWDIGRWRRYYLEHPLTGQLTRRLIWRFQPTGSDNVVGIPSAEGTVRGLGATAQLPTSGTVALWHPIAAGAEEVSSWRTLLMGELGLRQPFKQAFREIYLLTPAERQTRLYSKRFSGHVLVYQQLYALFKQRRWTSDYFMPHGGGYEGQARRDMPEAAVMAVFEHAPLDRAAGDIEHRIDLCSTEHVWFHRLGDRAKTPIPLAEIPAVVFSEAMRDVDLFVSVTSIALETQWADREAEGLDEYRARATSGQLSAVAEVRRDVLARLLVTLSVADRCELLDRHVRVRGNLGTYRIHIGSANAFVEPDRYLCIVATRTARAPMLPFDDDAVLRVILSKILLLCADDKITDPDIVDQLPPRLT